jgi:hypothetical protein
VRAFQKVVGLSVITRRRSPSTELPDYSNTRDKTLVRPYCIRSDIYSRRTFIQQILPRRAAPQ